MNKTGKAVILMMDSFGIGGAEDAAKFNDAGANTLGHIIQTRKKLNIPNLTALGLLQAAEDSCAIKLQPGPQSPACIQMPSKYGFMKEISRGKDTSSGHWEMAGCPVQFDWGYFPPQYPSFPQELVDKICQEAGLPGILGNKAASGTAIIEELGLEHIKTGKPICYTSADSVFQIAAHEKHFGLERLYKVCEIAFKHIKPYHIARVIARPFEGDAPSTFKRTKNRHDYSVNPPNPTLLDALKNAGGEVISVGKIADIFAKQGITQAIKASGLEELWNATLQAFKEAQPGSLIFTNFVDFDMTWGHRRDTEGYAQGLEYFDQCLPELAALMGPQDIAFITADHGCDPTYQGTDHTREHVPVILFGPQVTPKNIGARETYADLGQTAAEFFGLEPLPFGKSFLHE